MFLDEYKNFLLKQGKKPGTASAYCRKLQYFLDRGYSVNDLIGSALWLLGNYSKDGKDYDPKDHGNTVAALKQLNEFILDGCIDTLFIRYVHSPGTWAEAAPKKGYVIENRRIIVHCSNGKRKSKKIPDADFYALVKLMKENEKYLSDTSALLGTPPTLLDSPVSYYVYGFCDKSGYGCASLFEGNSQAESKYNLLIDKILNKL